MFFFDENVEHKLFITILNYNIISISTAINLTPKADEISSHCQVWWIVDQSLSITEHQKIRYAII